ncbi:hypothetical protein H6P81_021723 [Aristolochia fimbriata]|uniref:Uncharacterized protein n=1 Tax=Aristolochia fimbriata TaxID=158543 RepID=A0AAV7DQ57_ARIFI|nr:hypothetical protein H6P81_021723 [Aristolochia fimbriata]
MSALPIIVKQNSKCWIVHPPIGERELGLDRGETGGEQGSAGRRIAAQGQAIPPGLGARAEPALVACQRLRRDQPPLAPAAYGELYLPFQTCRKGRPATPALCDGGAKPAPPQPWRAWGHPSRALPVASAWGHWAGSQGTPPWVL